MLKFVLVCQGPKYNRQTLQLLSPSDDDSEPSSSDASSSDDSDDSDEEDTVDFFGRKSSKSTKRNRKVASKDRVYEFNRELECFLFPLA